jgi:hypothetical protein
LTTTQPKDEEPKPKKRRKIEKEVEGRPTKEKKKHNNRKIEPVEESNDIEAAAEAETGAREQAEPVDSPEDNEANSGADSDYDAQDAKVKAIFAKYRHSVQIQTAINSKKAKEGVKTPTPEPELHGKPS